MKFFKKITLLLICVFTVSFFVSSCSKDDNGGGGGSAAAGTITAKVDGRQVTTIEMATTASLVTQGGVSILTLQGSDSGHNPNRAFHFIIPGFDDIGTYEIKSPALAQYIENIVDPNNPTNVETDTWIAGTTSVDGELKVSEITDTQIKGTFHFRGEHTERNSVVEVTDGSFNMNLNRY